MKFLVISEPKPGVAPVTGPVLKAAYEWIQAKLQDHTIETIYNFPIGGGVAITNIATTEEAMKILYSYPLFHFFEFKIQPLADVKEAFDIAIAATEAAAKPETFETMPKYEVHESLTK